MTCRCIYFFYYSRDYGFGGHVGDLESAEMSLALNNKRNAIRVTSIAGAAHGVGWYTNELLIDENTDVVVPLHLLIEEGKHATAPDRNADGTYSHGYDVNTYLEDSWGVRDTMSGVWLQGGHFNSTMHKQRSRGTASAPDFVIFEQGSVINPYSLRFSSESVACKGSFSLVDRELETKIRRVADHMKFCDRTQLDGFYPLIISVGQRTGRPYLSTIEGLTFSFRRDRAANEFEVVVPVLRVPGLDGWVLFRIATRVKPPLPTDPLSFGVLDFLYSRSAGQLVDWYVAAGPDAEIDRNDNRYLNLKAGYEAGVKVRFPLPEYRRVRVPFVGFRVGIRLNELDSLKTGRVVLSAGFGAW